ncbi:hypothetical protein MLD38_024304 [Melastoma candidum]|uniref:Uncharacterized protein n=1 Tax=Melastoma candidum TaxID=119954 RepID=A0ACB9NTE8_9MYRT|nr:hypothetical protein MLD38_024304 [Melastoma candidum]
MLVSFPDPLPDLLCDEDSGTVLSEAESPGCSSDSSSPAALAIDGLLLTELVLREKDFVPGLEYASRLRGGTHQYRHQHSVSPAAREESVAWILKVHASYRFQPLTAYLSVNYMDRFLHSRCLPESDGWPMQLLSVACLSLAAKMEEPLVTSPFDLQVEGAKYMFQPRTIQRMELLVLSVLDWRLRSITPFSFLGFFALKVDPTGTFFGFLMSRATEAILSNIKDFSFLEYRPSCIATAAMLWAASAIPALSVREPGDAESWCGGLIKEEITSCYRSMEASLLRNGRRKAPKVLPQFRVTTRPGTRYSDSSPSPSSSTSSSDPHNKRRRLNFTSWTVDDKGISESEREERE